MNMLFNEDKTTQAAAFLLGLAPNKRMPYMSLLKLLYLSDRKALLDSGRTITFDQMVSMDFGPVLSKTLNLIIGENKYYTSDGSWSNIISPPLGDFEIELRNTPNDDKLSEYEEEILSNIYENYGHIDKWTLSKLTHDLPEWVDPKGTSIPIRYPDILKYENRSDIDIQHIKNELEVLNFVSEHFTK
jgi:uncharacterized phage-associated protein